MGLTAQDHQGIGYAEVCGAGYILTLKQDTLSDEVVGAVIAAKDDLVVMDKRPIVYFINQFGITREIFDIEERFAKAGVDFIPVKKENFDRQLATPSTPDWIVFLTLSADKKLETTAECMTYQPLSRNSIRDTIAAIMRRSLPEPFVA